MPFLQSMSKHSTKSLLTPIWQKIKKPVQIGFRIIVFYKAVSTIQILQLMLEITTRFFHHTAGKLDILQIPRLLMFYKTFNFQETNALSGMGFMICWLVVLLNYLLLFCTIISTKLELQSLERLSRILNRFMILHQYVLFLPIHTVMLEIIQACSLYKVSLFNSNDNTLFFTLATVIMLLNFFAGLLNLKCYSPLYAPKTYAKRNGGLAILDLFFKTFFSTCLIFLSSTTYVKWIALIIVFIFILVSYYTFHTQLPFFQIKVLEAYCILLGAKIAMGSSVIFLGIFDELRTVCVPDLLIGTFLVSLPFCIVGQWYKMIKTITNAITFEEDSYRTETDVFIHLLALRYIFKKGASFSLKLSKKETTNWNMQLNGVIARHCDNCVDVACGCRSFLELDETYRGIGGRKEKYRDLKVILMGKLYERGIEMAVNSELILLNLAQFYLLYLENYLRSYLVLQAFEKRVQTSFEAEVLVDYLKKRIQERMELKLSGNGQQGLIGEYEPNNLNVTALVQNDVMFIQLKKLIQEQVIKQLKFWDLIENFELNTSSIEDCCEEVDVVRNKIEKLWESLSKINHKCSSHYILFGLYQLFINNTTRRGERILNDYNRMHGVSIQEKEGITNDNLYSPQTVIIRISMRREKIGLIEECSGELESVFGYRGSDLFDTNVATLMSSFFKERHHNFVVNHFEKGTENALNRVKRLFGYHKDGYIFPIFLYVSIYPNIETGLSYMGIIRPRKVYNNYILLKSDGTIDSYSPEIAEYLGLESRKKYNIVDICPEFGIINDAFNYTTRSKYDGLKDDLPDFKGDTITRRSNEYQVKVTTVENYSSTEKEISKEKTDCVIMRTEPSENRGFIPFESRDDVSVVRSKERVVVGPKGSNKFKNNPKKIRRLNTEDIEEYKRVYELLSISGSVLSFVQQREKGEGSVKNFLCTVSDEVFDFSILRIITLGRNDENIEIEKNTVLRTSVNQRSNDVAINLIGPSRKDILSIAEYEDIGISKLPNYDEIQMFRNPFVNLDECTIYGDMKSDNRVSVKIKKSTYYDRSTKDKFISLSRNALNGSKDRHFNDDCNSSVNTNIINSADGGRHGSQLVVNLDDSRDFIQEMLHHDGILEKKDTISSSMPMKGRVLSKLEALLYKKEQGKVSYKFKSYFFIIALCFVMAIFNTSITNSSLQEGSSKVQKILSIGDRINALLDLNFNCRMLYLYLNDYISVSRHLDDKNITNYPQKALENVKRDAQNLLKHNNVIMDDIYELHVNSQDKFYQNLVQLVYPTTSMKNYNVKSLNSFEATDTIAIAALELSSMNLEDLGQKEDNIRYILLNSMNKLYIEMTNGYDIYEEDLDETLLSTRSITWGIAGSVLSIYFIFLIILFRDLSNTHKDKIKFWNSLIKLDTVKSTGHKRILFIFKENFENSLNQSLLKRALIDAKKYEANLMKLNKNKETQINGFKRLKNYKFKNKSYLLAFPFLIVLGVILGFFVASEVLVIQQTENKRYYMQEIRESDNYYQLNRLTLNGIYEFISEGQENLLIGLPIRGAIQKNLRTLSDLASFMYNFKDHSNFDPRLFIQMDLCDTYTSSFENFECMKDAKGLNSQGLLSLLTYAKETMENVMDFANASNGTIQDIQITLRRNNLITLETELKYISDAFAILTSSLVRSESIEQSNFQNIQIIVLVGFIVLLTLLNYFLVWGGFKRLDGQKFDNMMILRVIPTSMILESKMLKTYLLKSFKDDLSSITNKL